MKRFLAARQFRDDGRCFVHCRVAAVKMLADRHGSAQVVVSKPGDGGLAVLEVVGLYQGAGVLADQIVHAITAPYRFSNQVLIEKLIKDAARSREAGAAERCGGVRINIRPRMQAETAEQPLLICGEILI
jgi:hypothetical protein